MLAVLGEEWLGDGGHEMGLGEGEMMNGIDVA
jgi:hypothetical protein